MTSAHRREEKPLKFPKMMTLPPKNYRQERGGGIKMWKTQNCANVFMKKRPGVRCDPTSAHTPYCKRT